MNGFEYCETLLTRLRNKKAVAAKYSASRLWRFSCRWEVVSWTMRIGFQAPRTRLIDRPKSKAKRFPYCVRMYRGTFFREADARYVVPPTGKGVARDCLFPVVLPISVFGLRIVYIMHARIAAKSSCPCRGRAPGFLFAFPFLPIYLAKWRRVSPSRTSELRRLFANTRRGKQFGPTRWAMWVSRRALAAQCSTCGFG